MQINGCLLQIIYQNLHIPMTSSWIQYDMYMDDNCTFAVPEGKFVKLKISSFFLERFWFPEIILWARIIFVFKWSSPLGLIFILQMRNIWEALCSMQFSRLSSSVSILIVKFSYKTLMGWVQTRALSQSVGCILFSRQRKETSLWSLTNDNRLLWSHVITRNETEFKNHFHRHIKRWVPNLTFNLCPNFIRYVIVLMSW